MKTLIVAINSKSIHSSLAPWYLKAYCGDECGQIKVCEFTIIDNMDWVLSSIYAEKADVTAFSCYIWNIPHVLKLVESLKAVLPGTRIVLGGPEVSFDAENIIKNVPEVDFIICGEGEKAFKLLLKRLHDGIGSAGGIRGLVGRDLSLADNGEVQSDGNGAGMVAGSADPAGRDGCGENSCSSYQLVKDLDTIPSPYSGEMLSRLGYRIVYYESSRGCPFSCSYCLSSTYNGVRRFSMERVKTDLQKLIDAEVKQVKFVDRKFNADRERAKEIIRFIIEKAGRGRTNFHFEAAADLFDEEMLCILSKAPAGLIQFEIGIQTTNPAALA